MNLFVNALPLMRPLTGVKRYLLNLYREIAKIDDVNVQFYWGKESTPYIKSFNNTDQWMKTTRRMWNYPDLFVTLYKTAGWLAWEHRVKRQTNRKNVDIYHDTDIVPPSIRNIPQVFTLNDLSLIHFKNTHPRERVWFFNLFFHRNVKNVAHVITPSEFVKNDFCSTFHYPPDKVTTVYDAPDPVFYKRDPAAVTAVLEKFHIKPPYILSVGTLEPRKNIGTLIEAYKRLNDQMSLVMVGWQGWGEKKKWPAELPKDNFSNRIIYTGFIDDEILSCLYSGAFALVYPSLFEGFGLPVVEAMACGCPVVCSNRTSLPEVAGDAAILIDPLNPGEIKDALTSMISDVSYRTRLINHGFERSKRFTWEKTAEQTIEVFRNVLL